MPRRTILTCVKLRCSCKLRFEAAVVDTGGDWVTTGGCVCAGVASGLVVTGADVVSSPPPPPTFRLFNVTVAVAGFSSKVCLYTFIVISKFEPADCCAL